MNSPNDNVTEQEVFLTNSVIKDIDQLVSDVSELISIPEIYLKIRELMNDPRSNIDDFAVVVNTDPGLAAAVLKIVNSAFYGFSGQIEKINRALNLIGIGQLHNMVLSISAVNALDLSNEIEPLSTFWRRSIYCGVLSRSLAQNLSLKDAESLFVIGLLHEIGRLIFFQQFPTESKQVVIQAQRENRPLTEMEKNTFGFDYGQIGKALMTVWNLPSKFVSVTGFHIYPETATECVPETYIVHVAHQIAANKYPGPDGYQFALESEALARIKVDEEQILEFCKDANVISFEMENFILGS